MNNRIPCPFCHCDKTSVKPVWKKYWFVACDNCKAGGPVRKTPEEAEEAWNERRYEPTTRRIIRGERNTHYAWCETGKHPMNPFGEYCERCGRKVVE